MTNASLYDIEEWHLLAYKQCLFCCIINNFPFLLLKLLSNAPYHDQNTECFSLLKCSFQVYCDKTTNVSINLIHVLLHPWVYPGCLIGPSLIKTPPPSPSPPKKKKNPVNTWYKVIAVSFLLCFVDGKATH